MKRIVPLLALAFALVPATSAEAAQDLVRVLFNLVIERGQSADEVTCFGCSILVRGDVPGDVTTFGGEIEVEGNVGGDVTTVGGSIRLRADAKVAGDATALGGYLAREPQSVLEGDADTLQWFYWPGQREPHFKGVLALLGFHFGLLFVFYLAARRTRVLRIAQTLEHRPWWSLLAGILAMGVIWGLYWVLAEMAFRRALFRKLDEVMAWLVTALLIIVLGYGYAGLGCRLGRALRLRSGALAGLVGDAPLWLTVIGTLLIFVLELVPVLGTIAFGVFAVLAMGAASVSLFGTFPRPGSSVPMLGGPRIPA